MEVVGEAFLSETVKLLLSKLSSSVSEWLNLPEKVRAELQNWRNLLPKIGAVLEDAEEKQGRNHLVKLWLADLKDLFYDVEDILEEVDIDAKRSKASTSNPQQQIFERLTAKGERKMASRVKDITARFRCIEENISSLNLVCSALRTGDMSHEVTTVRLSTSALLEQHVYGREKDKEDILKILLSDEGRHEPYSVIPIAGMGGIGKTTLARLIYNDDKLKGRFGLQAWVCVSENFDVYRITRAILEQVTTGNCDKKELTPLQEKLQDELSGKKFLLVLDDIWNEDYELWENLQRPFLRGAPGSRIIITTRSEKIGKMMRGNDRVHHMSLLEDAACLSLFARHALGEENFDAYPDLKGVGEEIVEKCKRLPLAIKTLSGLLRGNTHRAEWVNILNSEIWDLPDSDNSILPALKLSYNHLPSHLKRCFGYCSIFPKDYEFDEGELVLLWMAEGLLEQPQRKKKLKDLGHQYFHDLLLRAFFQRSSRDESLFVMHDLMADLALHVAGEMCYSLELDGDTSDMRFQRVRHLSFFPHEFQISKRFEFLKRKRNLRTFLQINSEYENYLSNTLLQDLMKSLKCLRVLSLQNSVISKISNSIENLKHLRFINLSGTEIQSLLESVGYLLYLQALLLRNCQRFFQLPTTIGNLLDLQHLDVTQTPCLKEFPVEISNLTSLVTLPKFIVGNARGPRVKDLKNLSCLQGKLSILDLQNVAATNEAKEANLSEIEGLDDLSLKWYSDFLHNRNERSELQVLSWLKPHQGLKRLTISCFGGLEFPPWMGDPSFSNLEFLKLNNCQNSTSLPSVQRLPRLKELIITGIHVIQTMTLEFDGENSSIVRAFPSLERLKLQECPMLTGNFPKCVPVLKRLKIAGCPKLIYSPVSLPSLEELCIEECTEAVLRSMVDLNSLKTLRINKVFMLIWLPKSFVESLIALEDIEIRGCDELTCLWEEGANLSSLTCLKRMSIKKCPLLVSLTGKEQGFVPSSVQSFSIDDCKALDSLPSEILMMVQLEELRIEGCPALRMFPSGKLPSTLKILQIQRCEKLESLPEGILMNNGDVCQVSHLEELKIVSCPCLESFPSEHISINCGDYHILWRKHPSLRIGNFDGLELLCLFIPNLKILTIQNCKNLKSLPDKLQDLNFLDELDISSCPGIESIPDGGLPPNLTSLRISKCSGIQSIPDGGLPPNLTSLQISKCSGIQSIPDGGLPPNLTSLQISKCSGIQSIPAGGLPPNLTSLRISDCSGIQSIPGSGLPPSLTSLRISNCPRIESIPDSGFPQNLGDLIIGCENLKKPMQDWGLSNLTSLLSFEIYGICPPENVLPTSLTSLKVGDVENMKSIPRGLLQNLNSLQHLQISGWLELQTLPEEPLPASLQNLRIWGCKNFQSLPNKVLPPSLQRLDIQYCRNFQSLPKEVLPPSLEQLCIVGCPLLQRRCVEEKGDYWLFIAHIPCIEVLHEDRMTINGIQA